MGGAARPTEPTSTSRRPTPRARSARPTSRPSAGTTTGSNTYRAWRHELHEDGRTTWTNPTGEQVETFPELWVHVGDEVSPPPEGAKEEEEKEEPAVGINLLFHPNFHGPVPY